MRAACFLLVLLVPMRVGGCGGPAGGGSPAAPRTAAPAAATKAAGVVEVPEYCEGYGGCARENALHSLQAELPEGAEVPEAEIAQVVGAELERCRGIVAELSWEQQAWLESCTACGGSCDVYKCLDRVPEDGSEEFTCNLYDEPPPDDDDDEDGDGDGDGE